MSNPSDFNAYTCPLEGVSLVEASAGTGKTYNIQILFLRFILTGIPIEQILVVTFTEPATAELRDRLRRILISMKALYDCTPEDIRNTADEQLRPFFNNDGNNDGDNGVSNGIISTTDAKGLREARKRVMQALQDFDRAPISTIHGFCNRMLRENAFESGIRYGMRLRTDISDVYKEKIRDFWRNRCYSASREDCTGLMMTGLNPGEIYAALKPLFSENSTDINWGRTGTAAVQHSFRDAYAALQNATPEALPPDMPTLSTTGKKLLDPAVFTALRDIIRKGLPLPTSKLAFLIGANGLDSLFTAPAAHPTRGRDYLDAHPELVSFLEALVEILKIMDAYRWRLLRDALDYVTHEVAIVKARQGFMTFDDILLEFDKRLKNPDGLLVNAVRSKFKCALVDEFQDTDPVQYSIFNRIFASSGEHVFFMIGDPKQAIYNFRGGDIFAYMNASSKAAHNYTLTTNYRSSAQYIAAMNACFKKLPGYFDVQCLGGQPIRIAMPPARPRPDKLKRLLYNGQEPDNLLTRSVDAEPFAKIAREIRTLTAGGYSIEDGDGGRPLGYGDIAVLVRNKYKAFDMADALHRLGIPCYWSGEMSMLTSEEANCLGFLLEAVLAPGSAPLAVRLLASPLMRFTASQIDILRQGDIAFFQGYLQELLTLWEKSSFFPMLSAFLNARPADYLRGMKPEAIEAAGIDAERTPALQVCKSFRSTDAIALLRQLGNALNNYEAERRLSPRMLAAAFKLMRAQAIKEATPTSKRDNDEEGATVDSGEDDDTSAFNARLLSQAPAVRIITIHKSKGLQFPVVFMPNVLNEQIRAEKCHIYHTFDGNGIVRRYDMGGENDIREQCAAEDRQEGRRQLYVAVTRAAFLCRYVDKDDKIDETGGFKDAVTRVDNLFPDAAPATAPSPAPALAPVAETFNQAAIFPGWLTCSYSSLSACPAPAVPNTLNETIPEAGEAGETGEADDRDAGDALQPAIIDYKQRAPIFKFPAGTRAGTCWHAIFEKLDFQAERDAYAPYVENQLAVYNQLQADEPERTTKLDAFLDMVHGVLNCPLQDGIMLKNLTPAERLHELRFTYKLANGFHSDRLAPALAAAGVTVPPGWAKNYGNSFAMTGAIDLLFRANCKYYILDWKTNCIGADFANFGPDGLSAEMNRNFYRLQYLIYIAAFLQYYAWLTPGFKLTEQSYDSLFGGVFYLFLRGINAESIKTGTRGVFFDRPPFKAVKILNTELGVVKHG